MNIILYSKCFHYVLNIVWCSVDFFLYIVVLKTVLYLFWGILCSHTAMSLACNGNIISKAFEGGGGIISLIVITCTSNGTYLYSRGRRIRDHMIVGFITTYAISAHHHWHEFESYSGKVYSIQLYVINGLRKVSGFLRVLWFPPLIKLPVTI